MHNRSHALIGTLAAAGGGGGGGNYIWDVLGANMAASNDDRTCSATGSGTKSSYTSELLSPTDKVYVEFQYNAGGGQMGYGIACNDDTALIFSSGISASICHYPALGRLYNNGAVAQSGLTVDASSGAVYSAAVDMIAETIQFRRNNALYGSAVSLANILANASGDGDVRLTFHDASGSTVAETITLNRTSAEQVYSPPSGFVPIQ